MFTHRNKELAVIQQAPESRVTGTPKELDRPDQESIVVIGNGPVGFRFVESLVDYQLLGNFRVSIFGEEPRPAYDRVNLTKFLDDASPDSLQYKPRSWYEEHNILLHTNDPVVSIDRQQKTVRSKSGRSVSYDRLVLATGSRPFIPPIPGIDLPGVFAYRTIDDLASIRDYATGCRRAVVLGGGLLGLESAHALAKLKLNVFVVEMASVLMPRQLDNAGAELLKKMIESARIQILLQRQTEKITWIDEGLHVQFSGGESVVVDMVVVSAGIRPRDELARDCELPVGKRGGIVVDDHLQTADPGIYAIGECAEHKETVYGLVAPGFQMATTLVDRLRGTDAAFPGSNEATRLKLVGINVVFVGDYLDPSGVTIYTWAKHDCYAKLIVRSGRLVGMIGVGEVPQFERLKQAIDQRERLYWWNTNRFEASGKIWQKDAVNSVESWPLATVVCSCHGVTRGCLTAARERGCMTVEAIAADTKATTACGSCLPLVQQFAGQTPSETAQDSTALWVGGFSVSAMILLVCLVFAAPIDLPTSVQTAATLWQTLVTNVFWKQVTGYSLLALAVISLVISVRKRTAFLQRFRFTSLRVIHVALATAALAVLIAHTGFHRGSNLNFVLFSTFIAASLTGSVVGIVAGTESRLPKQLRVFRRPLTLLHILCLWPLPLLIGFHIVSVYWL